MNNETTHILATIRDTKSELLWVPQTFRSKAEFIRSVQMAAKDTTTMLHKFPADFDLVVVGEWSEREGVLSTSDQRLGSVLDLCPLN